MSQALPVDDQQPDFDGPATTAVEYMRRVRWEASGLPSVLVAADAERLQRTDGAFEPSEADLTGSEEADSIEKDKNFAAWFQSMRDCLRQAADVNENPFPADEPSWHRLCFSEESAETARTSQVRRLEHVHARELILLYDRWVRHEMAQGQSFATIMSTESRASWLFSALVMIEEPIDGDTSAAMSALCRSAAACREAEAGARTENESLVEVFVQILSGYFGAR